MLIAALVATVAGIAASLELMWGRFAIGGGLMLASVLILRWPRSIWIGAYPDTLPPRARRLALLAVCTVAVFFRGYHLNQPGLWGDDALNGLLAFDILDGTIHSPFQIVRHSYSNFHALSNYPIAAAFRLLGADLTTLRLPGVILGALCVPLLYATVAPLFGSAAALLAALFYASSPPQLTHAKQLVQIITGQFFQLAGMCLLVRGIAGRRAGLIAAAGVPLALCVYTYHSARLAPLVAVAYALAVWKRGRLARRSEVGHGRGPAPPPRLWAGRPRSPALAGALVLFGLTLIPAVRGYLHDPEALVQRVSTTSIWPLVRERGSLWPLWDAAWRTLLIFHYAQGPEYHWFGIGFDPAVNAVIGFLLVHGLVESLRRWREPRHLLLLGWFAVGIVPGVLSTGAPRLYRAFLATPPVYVWAALPVARLLAARAPGWSRAALRTLAVALVAAVPIIDFNYYFYRVNTHPAFRWFQGERMVEMARTLRDFGPGWTGYLLADTFDAGHETFRFLSRAWGLQMRSVASLADVLPLRDPPERGALFIMSHGALGAAAAIERMYPGRELVVHREPAPRAWWLDRWWPLAPAAGEPQISAGFYPVSRADAAHPNLEPAWGLDAEFEIAGRHVARREPYPFYLFLAPGFAHPFDSVWRGRLTIPEPGGYRIELLTSATTTIWVDGRIVGPNDALPAGEHELTLQLRGDAGRLQLAIFWQPPGARRELVPPQAFAPPRAPAPPPHQDETP